MPKTAKSDPNFKSSTGFTASFYLKISKYFQQDHRYPTAHSLPNSFR